MKFNDVVDQAFELLNPDVCKYFEANIEFFIGEKAEEGFSKIRSKSVYPCFLIENMDKMTFKVLKKHRCADTLVFQYDRASQKWFLHIFEFKKTISKSKFETDVITQLDNGLVNAYAISGILRIEDFSEVILHCGYRRNSTENSTVDMRSGLGEAPSKDWLNGTIELPSFPYKRFQNQAIKLDVNGCADFLFS